MTLVVFFVPIKYQKRRRNHASLFRILKYMSEQKRYMNFSLDVPYSNTPPSYNTSDALLEAMDAYIEECEAQDDLRGLPQYENPLDVKVNK